MTLGERIKMILSELNMTQVSFAEEMGVTPNYINQLANGKKENVSPTLAKLIEKNYGYSEHWLTTGEGEIKVCPPLTVMKSDMIKNIQAMPDDEVAALLAFAHTLADIKEQYQPKQK